MTARILCRAPRRSATATRQLWRAWRARRLVCGRCSATAWGALRQRCLPPLQTLQLASQGLASCQTALLRCACGHSGAAWWADAELQRIVGAAAHLRKSPQPAALALQACLLKAFRVTCVSAYTEGLQALMLTLAFEALAMHACNCLAAPNKVCLRWTLTACVLLQVLPLIEAFFALANARMAAQGPGQAPLQLQTPQASALPTPQLSRGTSQVQLFFSMISALSRSLVTDCLQTCHVHQQCHGRDSMSATA